MFLNLTSRKKAGQSGELTEDWRVIDYMVEESAKPQTGKVSARWTISPSTLDILKRAADEANKQNEAMQRMIGRPLKDFARFAEMQREQVEAMKKVLDMARITTLSLGLPNITLQPTTMRHEILPIRNDAEYRGVKNEQISTPRVDESPEDMKEFIKVIERLAAAQEKSNQLAEKAQRARVKVKKGAAQILVLDEDAKLYLKNQPRACVDLSKTAIQRRILVALANGPIPTERLFAHSKSKSRDSYYKAIEILNSKAKNGLRIKKLIVNGDSGYRISSPYKLVTKLPLE